MSSNSTPPTDGGSIWSKPVTVWSTILIVVVVVAAIVLAVTSAGSGGDPNAAPSSTGTVPPPDRSDSSCGLPAGDQSVPTTTAPESTWELVGRIAAPIDEAYGPGVIEPDGLRSCYAHSPIGALYAVANLYVQGSMPDLAVRNIEEHVVPGVGQEVALEQIKVAVAEGSIGGPGDVSVQFAGFQFLSYGPESATIDIAARNSAGGMISFVTEVKWSDGDWKLVVQDNGQPAVPMRQLPSLVGYLPWSGA